MANTIMVVPGEKLDPGQVAIWEVHPDHPDGEVFIAAPHEGEKGDAVRVAQTPEVMTRLSDGRLVEQSRRRSRQAADDEDDEAPPAEPEVARSPRRTMRVEEAPPAAPPEG